MNRLSILKNCLKQTKGYVSQSISSPANILNGPVHPLTPPEPPPPPPPASTSSSSSAEARKTKQAQPPVIKHNFKEKSLKINSPSLGISNLVIPYLWLRDACQEAHSVHPATKQKLFRTSDIPLDIHPTKTTILDHHPEPELLLTWSHSLINQNPPESSRFKLSFLKHLDQPSHWEHLRQKTNLLTPVLWVSKPDRSLGGRNNKDVRMNKIHELQEKGHLFINYQALKTDAKIQKMALERLNSLGLVFFDKLDYHPDGQQPQNESELASLLKSLHVDIRRTFYGDLWDVVSRGNEAKNVANTNLPLDFHMDLVHFENPPRFQFLHCLKNEVKGGRSGFLDAYSVVSQLLLSQPEAFRTLASVPIGFEYQNDNHHTFYRHPTIELHPQTSIDRLIRRPTELLDALVAVNYSPPFQAPLILPHHHRPETLPKLVAALDTFVTLFQHRNKVDFEISLRPGQAVGFDNRRILHSRSAFHPLNNNNQNNNNQNTVHRWLKGAYVDGDSVWDRIRVLNA